MKRNSLLALTFLLTQTTSLWAMDGSDEDFNFHKEMEEFGRQFLSFIPHRPPVALPVQEAQIVQETEPFQAVQPAPTLQKAHPVQEAGPIQAVQPAPEALGVQEAQPRKIVAIFSEEIGQMVLNHLQNFGLPVQKAEAVWEDFGKIINAKIHPFQVASRDPHYIASALWRAHQEMSAQQAGAPSLPLKSLLSCLLTKDFSSLNRKVSLGEVQLVKSLSCSNPYFRTLEFLNAGITDTHLIQMGMIPHLTDFLLYENNITDKGVEVLLTYPNLQKLNLSKNKITSRGVALLAKSPTLSHLQLYQIPVGDKGAESLSRNTTLTFLNLRETEIGDPGAQALATNNRTLRELNLRANHITDKGAEFFMHCHHLSNLDVGRNKGISKDLEHFLSYLMPSNGYLNALLSPKGLLSLPQTAQKDRVRVLSIDGGGIRGILPGGLLNHIETKLTQKTGAQFYFAQHLDLIAGTSTGGLIGLGLGMPGERGRPKYTTQTLLDLYTTKGEEIFPERWGIKKGIFSATYSPEPIEKHLNNYFGDTYLSEALCPTLVTSFNLKDNEAHIFDSLEAKADEKKNFQLKGAGQATSAAPTYFPAAKVKNKLQEEFEFVDGGIYANNPTLLAIQRALQLYPEAKEYVIYSFGTGQSAKKDLSHLGTGGLIQWGPNIADVLMDNAAQCTENLIKSVIQKDPRIKYTRLQPHIQASEKEMDNVKSENIANLLKTVKKTIKKDKQVLDAIIEDFYKDFEKK
jgi:patatin-like phospholipase/acyl hydrolase